MKKIAEMSLEELQDYALKLVDDTKVLSTERDELTGKVAELTTYNQALQRRNNELLTRVEQQTDPAPAEDPQEVKTETCEEFAQKLVLGGYRI